MQVVMYHYVRPESAGLPPYDYYHLSLDDFRRQLDHFESEYRFTTGERFRRICRGEATPCENEVVLTFDDGLIDHREWVLPELERRGLWGLFFVNTGPIMRGEALVVHRVHSLLGRVPVASAANALTNALTDVDHPDVPPEVGRELRERSDRQSQISAVKTVLNSVLDLETATDVLDRVESAVDVDPPAVDELYLGEMGIERLDEAGMIVGAHTVTHPYLSRVSGQRQRREIERSFEWLDSICDPPVRAFAYPFGDHSRATIDALREVDCRIAFTTKFRNLTVSDIRADPLELPRRDCNEFPHGGATFEFK